MNKLFIKTVRKIFKPNIDVIDLAIRITYHQYRYNLEDLYYYDKKKKKWLTKLMPIIDNAFKIRWWLDKNEDALWDIFNNTLSHNQEKYHFAKKD
jgi:hypothetical protein